MGIFNFNNKMQPSDLIPSKKSNNPISNYIPKKDGIKNLNHLEARYKVTKPDFKSKVNWEEEQLIKEMVMERNPNKIKNNKSIKKDNFDIIKEENDNNDIGYLNSFTKNIEKMNKNIINNNDIKNDDNEDDKIVFESKVKVNNPWIVGIDKE